LVNVSGRRETFLCRKHAVWHQKCKRMPRFALRHAHVSTVALHALSWNQDQDQDQEKILAQNPGQQPTQIARATSSGNGSCVDTDRTALNLIMVRSKRPPASRATTRSPSHGAGGLTSTGFTLIARAIRPSSERRSLDPPRSQGPNVSTARRLTKMTTVYQPARRRRSAVVLTEHRRRDHPHGVVRPTSPPRSRPRARPWRNVDAKRCRHERHGHLHRAAAPVAIRREATFFTQFSQLTLLGPCRSTTPPAKLAAVLDVRSRSNHMAITPAGFCWAMTPHESKTSGIDQTFPQRPTRCTSQHSRPDFVYRARGQAAVGRRRIHSGRHRSALFQARPSVDGRYPLTRRRHLRPVSRPHLEDMLQPAGMSSLFTLPPRRHLPARPPRCASSPLRAPASSATENRRAATRFRHTPTAMVLGNPVSVCNGGSKCHGPARVAACRRAAPRSRDPRLVANSKQRAAVLARQRRRWLLWG